MDPHTHLDASHLPARGLDDILLYHMAISDLYAAGCPSGARISEDRSSEEARSRIREALPHLSKVTNTFISWGVRTILADLYDWHEPVTSTNWERLDGLIAERADNPSWAREILRRGGFARTCTELWRGRDGRANDVLQFVLEWGFFARTQWGQPDIPLYELERTWNENTPGVPIPVSFDRAKAPALAKTIRTVEDVHEAVRHYCALIPYDRVLATVQHLATDINFSTPDAGTMTAALKRRSNAANAERDVYTSYILHCFLGELAKREGKITFQFSFGAEALPFESAARLNQSTIGQVGEIIARYPNLKFQCMLASRHANQSLCTLARELPNLSLAGYWWHNFFPGAMRQIMEERLDMLPVNKQIGFFSDAYCVDWAYAKKALVRKLLAEVLAEKVRMGQYSLNDCASIGRSILYQSSVELLRMEDARNQPTHSEALAEARRG
jgi:hypothetical protein